MKSRFLVKKWNVTCTNAVKLHFLMNIWKLEDQYTIIFLLAVFPEEPWEIHFFEKSLEHVGRIFGKLSKNVRNGIRTKISACRYLESARNFDPNPMALVPDPKIRVLGPKIYKNSRYTAPWQKLYYSTPIWAWKVLKPPSQVGNTWNFELMSRKNAWDLDPARKLAPNPMTLT